METTITDAHRKFIDEDLHLSPRSRRTYDYSIRKFLELVVSDYGLDPEATPVTDLSIDHVTSFVAKEMPRSKAILVGLSGRGDKDVHVVAKALGTTI